MGLTVVPSPVVSEQPARGWDVEPVVSAHSQPHRALWLVASEQKVPSKGGRCSYQVHSMLAFILKLPFCGRIVTLDLQTLHPVPIQGAGKG